MTPVPQLGSRLRPVGSAPEGPSTLDSRRNWPVLVFALVFASCILFAHAWFNTDLGRAEPRDQKSEIRSQGSDLTSEIRLKDSGVMHADNRQSLAKIRVIFVI